MNSVNFKLTKMKAAEIPVLFLGRDKNDMNAHNVAIPGYGISNVVNYMKAWRQLEDGNKKNDFHYSHEV